MTPRIVEPLLGDDLVEIFGEGHLVLGLLAVELDDVRQILNIPESDIDRRRPDAMRDRVAPHPGEKTVEIAFRRRRNPAPQRNSHSGIASNGAAANKARRLGRKGIIDMPPLLSTPERLLPQNRRFCNRHNDSARGSHNEIAGI